MTRIVRTPDGIKIDPSGKLAGRGAYLHNVRNCWDKGLKGSLARALKAELLAEDHRRLSDFMATIPADKNAM